MPANYAPPVPEAKRSKPEGGLQTIGGLGLDQYECFKPYPGEDDNDPYSVPRDRVRDRFYVLVMKWCDIGGLAQYGVAQGNRDAAQEYFDRAWEVNSQTFRDVTRAALDPDESACRDALGRLAAEGRLKTFKVAPGDAAALEEFVTRIRACAARKFGG